MSLTAGSGTSGEAWRRRYGGLSEFLHPFLGCNPLLVELGFEHPMRVPVPSD
ncbi:MAG: hypothetical protein HG464_004365 [Bacteroidia bacterium]|nr:hypothetical protein [Bacteroidia bacterium]